MGACTSTARPRPKHQHRRTLAKNFLALEHKSLPPLPLALFAHPSIDFASSTLPAEPPIYHSTNTHSLIQLYSTHANTNNGEIIHWMSSMPRARPSIPVPRSRLVVYQSTAATAGNPSGLTRPMSITNRPPAPSSHPAIQQPRVGFIPRPIAPGLQQASASATATRSRSISPSSTASANSSCSSSRTSQRSAKVPPPGKATVSRPVASSTPVKPKATPTAVNRTPLAAKPTTTQRLPPQSSKAPPSASAATKTDVNAIRDRYKSQKRMTFFARPTPIADSAKSPSEPSSVIDDPIAESPVDQQKTLSILPTSSSRDDSAYASFVSPTNPPSSSQRSHENRVRAHSTLSSTSALSDALNQDTFLDDENCSLKSDDLLCEHEETLTLDSSSNSFSMDSNRLGTAPAAANILRSQSISQSTGKPHGYLRESLDELTRLSNRMENTVDGDLSKKFLTRSVSLKPPSTALPPLDDAEQISMDVESYRQVMKDMMVVKTILHQLDRLLKQSDGTNMTDSMIGSFHESMVTSRRFSTSGGGDGNLRPSIDENSSYDDLIKEIVILRKEKDQDKQTIKLLQEQMYKYSSQSSGS